MKLNKAGFGHRHPSDFFISRPKGSGDYLLLVVKTPGLFNIGEARWMVRPNSVVLFRKGTPQFYGARGGEYCDDWMHMELDDNDLARIEELGIPLDLPVELGDTVRISVCITEIYREYRADNPLSASNISLNFYLILNRIKESMDLKSRGGSAHYRRLLELRADIYLGPSEDWNVDDAAKKLNISRSTLQHLYRDSFKVSFMDDVIESRISTAKHMLEVNDTPVYRIAEICGYASDIHFIRQFRQRTGISPLRYRRTVRG